MEIIAAMTGVFDAVTTWLISALQSVLSLFWTAPTTSGGVGSLTVLGVLALIGLALSVVFLLIGVISNFFHLRG